MSDMGESSCGSHETEAWDCGLEERVGGKTTVPVLGFAAQQHWAVQLTNVIFNQPSCPAQGRPVE